LPFAVVKWRVARVDWRDDHIVFLYCGVLLKLVPSRLGREVIFATLMFYCSWLLPH